MATRLRPGWIAPLLLLLVAACAAPGAQPAATGPASASPTPAPPTLTPPGLQPDFAAPQGDAPVLDGVLAPGEWDSARVETFSDGSELFLLFSAGSLYIGVRGSKPETTAGNVFLDRGNEIAILHSSAALGTAVYARAGGAWERTQDFDWRCRATDDGPAAVRERGAFFEAERWLAANARRGTPNELEFRIEANVPVLRLAINLIRSSNIYVKVIWPAGLDDDTTRPTPGRMPARLAFDPAGWATIGLPDPDA